MLDHPPYRSTESIEHATCRLRTQEEDRAVKSAEAANAIRSIARSGPALAISGGKGR